MGLDNFIDKKNTKSSLLDELRRYYYKNGHLSSDGFNEDPNFVSSGTVSHHFGSWGEAVDELDIELSISKIDKSEDNVKKNAINHLNDLYPASAVYTEKTIPNNSELGVPDIIIPEKEISIECKPPKTTRVKGGVGQAISYSLSGYNSYLCIHDKSLKDIYISMCRQADIGLITVTDDELQLYVE